MRFLALHLIRICAVTSLCALCPAEDQEWPDAMIELEKLALQTPRRNAALAQIARFAAETARLDQWRARWERRARQMDGAVESLMLGWLAIEEGRADVARSWFTRAVELAPGNPYAQLAQAESLLRMGKTGGETHARRAAELFTNAQDKADALRLAAVIAQEKGEFAAAWAHLCKLEKEPLDAALRAALAPDFARAHLALDDWEKWAAALLASAGKSSANAAASAASCLALGDPATAHRVATEALKRDPGETVLAKLATAAAIAAGFGGDAAARIEASVGTQPTDDDLATAINTLATLGAPEHARRIISRNVARLAPIAARWRQSLPVLRRIGATEGLHSVLSPHTATGGWELQFVLAELALLEEDTASAEQALRQILSPEFDGHPLASTTRALAGKAILDPPDFPLVGQRLRSRCYSSDSMVHTDRQMHSLTQARDIALRDLGRMALAAGGDEPEKLATTLRERTGHWPPAERLLAYYFARQPAAIVEAAEAAAALPKLSQDLRQCIRVAISSIRKETPMPPELTASVDALKERFPFEKDAPREEPMPQAWRARLLGCWQLLSAGELDEADTAFAAALRDFADGGTGPDASAWASFYASLIHSAPKIPDNTLKTKVAAQVLRWIGMQAPRRANWPTAARPQMLWTKSSQQQVQSMFGGDRSVFVVHTFGSEVQPAAVGGSVPADLFPPLAYFAYSFNWLDQPVLGETLDAKLRDLPVECTRTALLARAVAAATRVQVNEDFGWFARLRESRDAQPAQIAAALSALSAAGRGRAQSTGGLATGLLRAAPAGPIGRAAWLAAALHIIARMNESADPVQLAAELATLPADADTRSVADGAIELLLSKARPDAANLRAVAGKLALAWLGKDEKEPLPSEWRTRLRILMNSAETDAANALARKILAEPVKPGTRLPEPGSIRLEAIRALDATGELPAWFSSLKKNASRDNPSDMQQLAQAACDILEVVKAAEPRPTEEERPRAGHRKAAQPAGLDASLRRDARAVQFDAEVRLVQLDPEEIEHWMALWFSTDERREPGEKLGEKPVVESAALLRAARAGLPPGMAFHFAGNDPRNVSELAARWPAPPAEEPIGDTVEIASWLWHAGEKEAALDWLRKMSGTRPYFLIEALAVRGDSAGIVDALASALLSAGAPAKALSPAFRLGRRDVPVLDRPFAQLLDEASALGVSASLAAKLADDPTPGAADLALLVHARERDATAATAITERLGRPMTPVLLEEFAWQLAGWPEGRDGAQAALRRLDPTHGRYHPDLRTIEIAHHGWLAARCGMESEAAHWLFQAQAQTALPGQTAQPWQRDLGPRRVELLLTVAEGMWRIGDETRAGFAMSGIAGLFPTGQEDGRQVATKLRQLANGGDAGLVREFCKRLSLRMPPRGTELATAISDALRTIAIREGEFGNLTPFAWLRRRIIRGTGGIETAWALGYSSPGSGSEPVLRVPEFPNFEPLPGSRLEIFHGTEGARLERWAAIENAAPIGRRHGFIHEFPSATSATFSTGSASALGPMLRTPTGSDLLPATGDLPGKRLPALIWKKRNAGPDGEAIYASHRPSQGSSYGDLFHASIIELPAAAGKEVVISGWARRELENRMDNAVILVLRRRGGESGRWALHHVIPGGPLAGDWQRFEARLTASEIAQHTEQPGGAPPLLALQLLPGCAFSGLRVTASSPNPGGAGSPGR